MGESMVVGMEQVKGKIKYINKLIDEKRKCQMLKDATATLNDLSSSSSPPSPSIYPEEKEEEEEGKESKVVVKEEQSYKKGHEASI